MATVKQYAAWAEQRIAAIVRREGLACGLISVVQGPLVLTYTVRLLAPSPASLRKMLGLGPALAQVLQVESVRMSDTAGGVQIEIPSPVQRTPRASELVRHTKRLNVAVGLNSQRQPVCIDLSQHGALLWVGPSRRGKTESLKSTVYGLLRANHWRRVQCLVLSQKRADWQALAGAAGCLGLLSDPAECSQALNWAASKVLQGRASEGKGIIPAMLVVVDDLLNLLERAPEIAGPLAEIASMGAGLAVHLLAGTQEAGSKRGTGGPAVEANVTCRIVYRSSSAAGAARAAGMGGAGVEQLTSAKGDALLIEHGEAVRIATGWADDREILQLEQGQVMGAPWRTLQPVTTGHNRLQPPQPPVVPPITTGHVPPSGRGGSVAVVPVVPVAAVVTELFPIDKRAATPAEKRAIQALHKAGESLSALCRRVYGHKDGKALAWVKEAIGSGSSEPESEQSNELDLNTAEGLAALEALKASGAVKWRDASEILQ